MIRLYTYLCLIVLATASLQAQTNDARAADILDKTAAAYRQAGAVSIDFGGTQQGTMLLKGECFYLNCAGVESWFDGKTQWSYVQANNEVTVSSPTAEELQSINPYLIVHSYRTAFHYRYNGTTNRQGKLVHEILLTPRESGDIQSVTLQINSQYIPQYIRINLADGKQQNIEISSYQTLRSTDSSAFRFDARKHPGVEVVDMR